MKTELPDLRTLLDAHDVKTWNEALAAATKAVDHLASLVARASFKVSAHEALRDAAHQIDSLKRAAPGLEDDT